MPSRLLRPLWALPPPFHPYIAISPVSAHLRRPSSDPLKVFLQPVTKANCTGGLFSVALSVTEPARLACAYRKQTRPPGVTRRVALQSSTFPLRIAVSGLSSRPAFLRRPAQRSPGLPANSYY